MRFVPTAVVAYLIATYERRRFRRQNQSNTHARSRYRIAVASPTALVGRLEAEVICPETGVWRY